MKVALRIRAIVAFELGLLFFCLVCNSGLQAQQTRERAIQPSFADLVINASVVQCDPRLKRASSVAVMDGRIVAVGEPADLSSWIGNETQVVDAKELILTPGFTDSHLHFIGLGQSLQMLDLKDADSWRSIVERVARTARLLPKGAWIEGRGWHQSKWSEPPAGSVDGYPSHQILSRAVPDHPVVLTHASGHALFANETAMRLAGVGPETSDPIGGEILKDDSGNPIGVFRENASQLILRAQRRSMRQRTEAEIAALQLQQVQLAGRVCLEHGITSVHDAGSSFETAGRLKRLAERGQLPVRIALMIREPYLALKAKLPSSKLLDVGDGFFSVRSVKVSIDGALGPHGAWLLQPYTDLPQKRGLNTVALDDFAKIAALCKQLDWQLCVHAIGDRANREVLDVYERVLGEDVGCDHRWRIEHAQHLSPSDIPRFGKLGVIPAMQANHCTSDAIFVPARLGERRSAEGAYVWRSLIDAGAIIPNGTDAPVERVDPRVSLYAAVTRQLSDGSEFFPEQCMTREEALWSYTLWPAIASFQDQELGSIEVGKRADLVLWDTDFLTCDPQEILTAQVKRVWINGKQAVSE